MYKNTRISKLQNNKAKKKCHFDCFSRLRFCELQCYKSHEARFILNLKSNRDFCWIINERWQALFTVVNFCCQVCSERQTHFAKQVCFVKVYFVEEGKVFQECDVVAEICTKYPGWGRSDYKNIPHQSGNFAHWQRHPWLLAQTY